METATGQNPPFDHVVVWRLRYFAWNLDESIQARDQLATNGIRLLSVKEQPPKRQHTAGRFPTQRIFRRRKEHSATVAGVTTQLVEATQPSSPLLDRGSGGDEKSIAAVPISNQEEIAVLAGMVTGLKKGHIRI